MANLVIKPASGSTNKLVFQNQAGNVDAITVEDSGNTTLAGASNNLGTVTAGSIAGGSITSATTFPAGHVIQTTAVAHGVTYGSVGRNNGTFVDSVITNSITPLYSDSSILLFANFIFYVHDTSGDCGTAYRAKKVHSGGTSYPDSMNTYSGTGNMHGTVYHNWGNGDGTWHHCPTLLDPTVGVAGSSVTYTLQGDSYNTSNTCTMGGHLSNRWHIFLQEIKR